MRESPTGQDLLETARQTLLDRILPALSAEQRYDALMIANAIAIAQRQWQTGDAWLHEERLRIEALTGTSSPSDAPLGDALLTANRTLIAQIRAGHFDEPRPEQAELLTWMVSQRVRESAPKAL
ncbi:hypothetical protein HDN1F_02210 [gamma proteobacterium HdN1]|nr:hypothetical protein HDN1F_02210 [gamma proteobacterium HdN1]